MNGGIKILQGAGFVKSDDGTSMNIGVVEVPLLEQVAKKLQEMIKE